MWQRLGDPKCLDQVNLKANKEMKNTMLEGLGHFLLHPAIWVETTNLHRADRVNSLYKGSNIFLEDLWQRVWAVLGCLMGKKI